MIASSAFFVLDAILDWPVSLYDGSWSQWGQMAAYSAPSGTAGLKDDSPWRTDIPSRSELVVYNYDTKPGPVFYTAATATDPGLNDMKASGTFSGTANRQFRVQIDNVGTPDTFSWTTSSATTTIVWNQTGVPIAPGNIALGEGMLVSFASTTGHTLNDRWDFVAGPKRPVEVLALDGSICSSRLNLDTSTTVFPTACTPLLPNSYAATANQIEEEDAVYFGVGGGGSGGGGGGPIAPGY